MSFWVTDMKTKNPNKKNLYHICKSLDVLDHWRYELNTWTFENLKHVDFKSTLNLLMDDLSKHILSR